MTITKTLVFALALIAAVLFSSYLFVVSQIVVMESQINETNKEMLQFMQKQVQLDKDLITTLLQG